MKTRHIPNELLLVNISELVTCEASSEEQNPLGRKKNACVLVSGETVRYLGDPTSVPPPEEGVRRDVCDLKGAVVFPGLIDSHTHPVFSGNREREFARRISGVPYMVIAQEGGGINATVRATRQAGEEELFHAASGWLSEMAAWGVTAIEGKSGYGLTTESELKQLRVLQRLNDEGPLDVVPTFMGAHDFPTEYKSRPDAYVDLVVNEMLPAVSEQGIARFADVFCEKGVFTPDQARRILDTARRLGLGLRLHADEFADSSAAALAGEMGVRTADHLMMASDDGLASMKRGDVIATLLPATSYFLGLKHFADARKMLSMGLKVALATDFNPGSAVGFNLPLVANMGCTQLRMTFEEVILAVTAHGADAIDRPDLGRIRVGAQADLLVLDIPTPEYFVYHFGRCHTWKVMKKGRWIVENPARPHFLSV